MLFVYEDYCTVFRGGRKYPAYPGHEYTLNFSHNKLKLFLRTLLVERSESSEIFKYSQ